MSATAESMKDRSLVDRVAAAVLYEGYVLYPYRPSSVKNQQRWNFGVVCPESYSIAQKGTEAALMQTECLLVAGPASRLSITVKFLQLISRQVSTSVNSALESSGAIDGSDFRPVSALEHDGRIYNTWQEAVEREVGPISVELSNSGRITESRTFEFGATETVEELRASEAGPIVGLVRRVQSSLAGQLKVVVTPCKNSKLAGLLKVNVQVSNTTPFEDPYDKSRDEALLNSFVSTHTVLRVQGGEFVSLLDPPEEAGAVAAECRNVGAYPVLVGVEGERDCMLSSPIILYDYPQIAAESPGDLFDGTEIDEILTLRILTLTDAEKREIRASDDRARRLLERTETLPLEEFMKLHGAMKGVNRK